MVIPDSVTEIGNDAFNCCENLEEVHLPETDSEITIYGAAFRGCKKLKTFDFSNVSNASFPIKDKIS